MTHDWKAINRQAVESGRLPRFDEDGAPLVFTVNEGEGRIEFDSKPLPRWHVSVNNNQRIYVVQAPSAADACMRAGTIWRDEDSTVTHKQHAKGIYDIRARPAKFSE